MDFPDFFGDMNITLQTPWVQTALQVLLILAGTWILWVVLKLVIVRGSGHWMRRREGEAARRGQTLIDLTLNTTKILVLALAITLLLGEFGINLGPIIAAAGVIGIAIGFGAQSLVADILNGFFFIAENQVRVGDIVIAADKAGVVESIGLRTLSLRSFDGILHIIPHSSVTVVSNMTHQYSRALVDVGVAYKEDPEHVVRVLMEVAQELSNDPEWKDKILEEPEVFGIDAFGDSSLNFRVRMMTAQAEQWNIARQLRRRIKVRFDQEGIEIPFPHRTVYWGVDDPNQGRIRAHVETATRADGETVHPEPDQTRQKRDEKSS